MTKPKEPRIAVFCPCGAQWLGRVALDNPVIADHRRRCGPPISAEAYQALGYRIKWPLWWTESERAEALRPPG
jgi:hypothetical protein